MSTLHVVFGTGALGRATVSALARRGHRVRAVNRAGQSRGLPAGVEFVRADAAEPAEARAAARGAAVVYQCAQPGYTEWPARFPPLQASILGAARAAGARLVVGDNLYMYGPTDGPLVETLPYAATTRKGAVRARMAEALLEAHARGEVEVALGRASDFFGPGVSGSAVGERLFHAVARGKAAGVFGDPDALHTYTFVEDFGEALAVLGERDEALGRAWHVPSAPTGTTRAFVERAFQIAGHPPRVRAAGRTLMRLVGLAVPEVRESVEMLYAFERPFVVDHSAYAAAFGDHATPLVESLTRALGGSRDRVGVAQRGRASGV